MPATCWIAGVLTSLADARIPVTDRGFLWGDHVFEVVRARGAALCDGPAHLARLAASARLVRLPAPDLPRVEAAIAATLAAAGEEEAGVRVVWTRGDPAPAAGGPRLVIIVEPLPAPPAGVRLAVVRGGRGGGLVPAAAKSGNYLGSALALAAAADRGADDALLVDEHDRALETATASLFVVSGQAVATPTGALLPGVTAARVATLLGAAGFAVRARPVSLAEVRAADALFVTSSRRGPVAVVALDGATRAPGPVTAAAVVAYRAWIATQAPGATGVPAPPGGL